MTPWDSINSRVVRCRRCPRLRDHCREIGRTKRRAFREWDYWSKPVPNFGDSAARLLIVGLAPAAHGANRTGRMFTGDRSGDWLYRAMHKAGFANQAKAESQGDGLTLQDCAITAACHCAPPDNKPTAEELGECRPWLTQTIAALPVRVFLALGQIGWNAICRELKSQGLMVGKRPAFGHRAVAEVAGGRWVLGSYHPSQQNTFTGRLTEEMLDDVFADAKKLLNGA